MSIDPCNKFELENELVTQPRKFKSCINFVFGGLWNQLHFYTTCLAPAREIARTFVDELTEVTVDDTAWL